MGLTMLGIEILTYGLIASVLFYVLFALFRHPQGMTVIFALAVAGVMYLFQNMKSERIA